MPNHEQDQSTRLAGEDPRTVLEDTVSQLQALEDAFSADTPIDVHAAGEVHGQHFEAAKEAGSMVVKNVFSDRE